MKLTLSVLAGLLIFLPAEQVLAQAVQQEAISVQQAPPTSSAAADFLRVPPPIENTGGPTVFHRKGQPIKNPRNAWNKACVKAGNPGAWFHDLRRSAVRNMERAGVSRSVAMKVTGHKTESIYKRYAIADVVSLEEGLQKLAGLDATGNKSGTAQEG